MQRATPTGTSSTPSRTTIFARTLSTCLPSRSSSLSIATSPSASTPRSAAKLTGSSSNTQRDGGALGFTFDLASAARTGSGSSAIESAGDAMRNVIAVRGPSVAMTTWPVARLGPTVTSRSSRPIALPFGCTLVLTDVFWPFTSPWRAIGYGQLRCASESSGPRLPVIATGMSSMRPRNSAFTGDCGVRALSVSRSISTLVVLPLAPSRYVSAPFSTSRLPMPNAAAPASAAVVDEAVASARRKSQLRCPCASVSSAIVGSISVKRTISNRRFSSGSSATCASTRFAAIIAGALPHGALPSVTSDTTSFGSSESLRSTRPRIARSRPVSSFTRAWIGPTNEFTSIALTAIATAISSSTMMPTAIARMRPNIAMRRL